MAAAMKLPLSHRVAATGAPAATLASRLATARAGGAKSRGGLTSREVAPALPALPPTPSYRLFPRGVLAIESGENVSYLTLTNRRPLSILVMSRR
jgi:hypothetical protein